MVNFSIQLCFATPQAGLEPATLGLENQCSIQLSYWRKGHLPYGFSHGRILSYSATGYNSTIQLWSRHLSSRSLSYVIKILFLPSSTRQFAIPDFCTIEGHVLILNYR